ncbi:mannosyltransferase [Novosphingobium sp. FSY-8]|uniref:Mannosyltransferase n=1 Tax=Novosphingobium ovatum TaxID=1908523 RepID=A0ABW9XB89_9SPHN|nr:mannosyltransferase [Novosphingobium ovatum]NBC35784.1 mannosyltransferase [Novosphingobium ovatum]
MTFIQAARMSLRSRGFWLSKNRLVGLVALAAILFRVAMACQPGFHQPDEIWQYVEPAWGWITGHWIATWEFHVGLRGWLVPMMFRPILATAQAIAPGAQIDLALLRLVIGLISLVIPYTFWRLGAKISASHAIVAGWVGAIWPEVFYFSTRPSGENLATILIMSAILAFYANPRKETFRTIWIGFSLALAAAIRFQYLPAIGVLGLAALYAQCSVQKSARMFIGAAAGLALSAAADLAAGQPPFGWLMTNFSMNLSQNRSAFFGTQPAWWYGDQIIRTWSIGTIVFIPAIVIAARRFPLLLAIGLITIVTHSLIPHKEYRFILLGQLQLIFLAAIGTVDIFQKIRWSSFESSRIYAIVMPLWFALAMTTSLITPFVDNWGKGRALFHSMALASGDPALCGLAIYRAPHHPTASYALLGRSVPILLIDGPNAKLVAAANASSFNMAFAPRYAETELPNSYRLVRCEFPHKRAKDQYYCIFKRPGLCPGVSRDFDYNASLSRLGH